MLIVTVELHSAITGKITEVGRMHIINDGTGDRERGQYDVHVLRKGTKNTIQRRGMVRDYPRLSYSVWELVRRGLQAALGKNPVHNGVPEDEGVL
jgi:hypothetical protein